MSILTTIKKMLGLSEDDTTFDQDIVVFINTAIMGLTQIGIGPQNGYFITDKTQLWEDLTEGRSDIEAVKSFIYLKTRLLFDPPNTAYVLESTQRILTELEWRLHVQVNDNL